MGRKRKKILLENVHISDAGAKGKAITRLENGLVLFVEEQCQVTYVMF